MPRFWACCTSGDQAENRAAVVSHTRQRFPPNVRAAPMPGSACVHARAFDYTCQAAAHAMQNVEKHSTEAHKRASRAVVMCPPRDISTGHRTAADYVLLRAPSVGLNTAVIVAWHKLGAITLPCIWQQQQSGRRSTSGSDLVGRPRAPPARGRRSPWQSVSAVAGRAVWSSFLAA